MRPSPVVHEVVEPVRARPPLKVVPPPAVKERRSVPLVGAIVAVILAMLISAGGTYLWQHDLVTNRDAAIASLRTGVSDLQASLATQRAYLSASTRAIARQQALIATLRAHNARLFQQYQIAVGQAQAAQAQSETQLQAAQRAQAQTEAQLAAANATIDTMVGPPLADGKYVGYLMAVGAAQATPRVVIDRAKMVNGVLVNEDPAWRTVAVTQDVPVTVLGLNPYHPQAITFERLANLARNPAPWAVRVAQAPFRITVVNGIVTAIREIHPT